MIRELAVTELKKELEKQNIDINQANIWDVRDIESYQSGHIEGAKNHPVNEGLDKNLLTATQGTIYVLCGGGSKAPRAANQLHSLDNSREIVILTGGTRAAKAAGMTIVTESE